MSMSVSLSRRMSPTLIPGIDARSMIALSLLGHSPLTEASADATSAAA